MLGHRHGHHRQLLDLMARRLPNAHALGLAENMSSPHLTGQCSMTSSSAHAASNGRPLALMPRLRALLAL
jgi:hypothetical protein